jgi:hypothetical protein
MNYNIKLNGGRSRIGYEEMKETKGIFFSFCLTLLKVGRLIILVCRSRLKPNSDKKLKNNDNVFFTPIKA